MVRGLPAAAAAVGSAVDDHGGKDYQRSSWPELVGDNLVLAGAVIKTDRPDVILELHAATDPQPPEFNPHRVCLFMDNNLIIVKTPFVG